jgi:hypothetical protein
MMDVLLSLQDLPVAIFILRTTVVVLFTTDR